MTVFKKSKFLQNGFAKIEAKESKLPKSIKEINERNQLKKSIKEIN